MPQPPSAPGRARRRLPRGALVLSLALGVLAGVGGYTFRYAEGLSYLSADPRACVNCHVMQPEFDGWQKASHHTSAVCVDCHLPESFVPKYLAKAENGWRHSRLFTTGGFREPLQVGPVGLEILQANCVRCHEPLVAEMAESAHGRDADCLHCHSTVGHGPRFVIGGPLRDDEIEGRAAPPPPPGTP